MGGRKPPTFFHQKKGRNVSAKRKFNAMFDVAFTIVTEHENYEDIPVEDLIVALEKRVLYLKANPNEAIGAFGFSDSYEIPQKETE